MIDTVKNYFIAALFLILCGTAVYAYSLKKVVASDAKLIQEQRDQLGGYKKDLESTTALVKAFSDSFDQLKADQAKREKAVQDAMLQVEEIASLHITYSAKLLAETPKSTDLCKESDDLINAYITKGAVK